MTHAYLRRHTSAWLLLFSLVLVTVIYWPGLSGSWLFDDYPNIVDNHGVQPANASVPSLVNAALSSPSSEFKRPLASLSFAANYLAVGLNPYWWKLTNLLIHLLNGILVFVLARALLRSACAEAHDGPSSRTEPAPDSTRGCDPAKNQGNYFAGIVAALIAAGWMLLPINLTGVLYVVQRMESMANLFVLLGLIGYVASRRRMLDLHHVMDPVPSPARRGGLGWEGFFNTSSGLILCLTSIIIPTALGILAKETAVILPLYAGLIEWALFRFQSVKPQSRETSTDRRIVALFLLVLMLPALLGLTWLLPHILKPETWATRDFTLGTRLLSEARIVVDYIVWTLLPTTHALSFYHDDFAISHGLLSPWTTLTSLVFLAALIALTCWLRSRRPLVALGISLFLGCQLLTGTILPLELIYEHRNYFASFGLMLAIVPLLAAPSRNTAIGANSSADHSREALPMALPRYVLLAGLMLYWTTLTAFTAYAWGDPLRLAQDLANRAPQSPRAQYELGRTYIMYSHYDPTSPYTQLAYAPLEQAASLPKSSILPQQALIFMNSRMHLPLKDAWWDSMIAKLKAHDPGVQDESSLAALTHCVREQQCDLPQDRMTTAFTSALSHPHPNARLFATYGDYAWHVMKNRSLGLRMTRQAVEAKPDEPAYRVTLVRMLANQGQTQEAKQQLAALHRMNIGGRLDDTLATLKGVLDSSANQ